MLKEQYNVWLHICSDKGESIEDNAKITFVCNESDYGNGYHMGIESKLEAFGFGGYDLRYRHDFNRENKISFIAGFYENRFDGKDGAWKLLGIRINEAEF